MGCAFFDYKHRTAVLTLLLLFLPLTDKYRALPVHLFCLYKRKTVALFIVLAVLLCLMCLKVPVDVLALTLVFVALPEEWFFRAYFMKRIEVLYGNELLANVATSALFVMVHAPMQGVNSLAVFFPSLLYGWIYQKCGDLFTVVVIHALSNIIYMSYIRDALAKI